jgi:hypothetical protein
MAAGYRRWCLVSIACVAAVAGQAMAGFTSTAGGVSCSMPAIAGFAAGVVITGRFLLVIPVDPGATYQLTTSVSGTGTVTIQQWMEVDE